MTCNPEIHVLFCANPQYFQHLATAVASLALSNPKNRFRVHIITCDRDPREERRLNETLQGFASVAPTLYLAGDDLVRKLYVDGFLTKECYLRLIASEILPADIHRVIYLDCDLVVADDVLPLWETDLGHNVLAGAPDYPRLPEFMSSEHRGVLGIPIDATYVNSGVLVMDLDRWRSENLAQRLLEYVNKKGAHLAFHDQDAINAVLSDSIHLLDPRWNLQARMFNVGRRFMPEDFAATRDARKNPAIIHFTGSEKPWLFRSRMAKKGCYFGALQRTAWRGTTPPGLSEAARREFQIGAAISRWFDIDYLEIGRKLRRAAELLAGAFQLPGTARSKPGLKRN